MTVPLPLPPLAQPLLAPLLSPLLAAAPLRLTPLALLQPLPRLLPASTLSRA